MSNIIVSKLDAVRRQLDTVVRLYFSGGDPISIHTLTAAAYNVVRDVTTKTGGDPMLVKDQVIEMVIPERRKEVRDKFNEAENFFKHADNDHDQQLSFNPELTDYLILDAITQYRKLTAEFPIVLQVFQAWIMVQAPHVFVLPANQHSSLVAHANDLRGMARPAFFDAMLSFLARQRA